MRRWTFALVLAIAAAALALNPASLTAGEIQGKIKSIDAEHRTLTLTVDGAEKTVDVAADAKVTGLYGKKLKKAVAQDVPNGLRGLKEGANVTLTTATVDGKDSVSSVKVDDLQPKLKKKAKAKKKARAK